MAGHDKRLTTDSGAFCHFEATKDITKWTKTKFLNAVGKKTETFIRVSTVALEAENIAGQLAAVPKDEIVKRSIFHFKNADADYGNRIVKPVAELRNKT